ncbi:MAG: NAD(P)H-dependent oxidoreductase [Flavobacteriaceae bacterium]|nr:NAD(P)H-dependent oxidoreductase [Flavobacteriaceae bacterium]|tara:strand:+ start:243 stop:881 length:639 start_codon:yes stop_codon:yes gene_type:complete
MKDTVIDTLSWRYATKKFDPERRIPDEKLDIIKEAFNLTATSYGLQPLRMMVIEKKSVKEALVPLTMEQRQVADASHVLVLCVENTLDSSFIKNYFNRVETTRNTPRAILKPFEKFLVDSFSEKNPEEIQQWMEKQAYIALGNLLTVCALEEIDTCPIEGFEPEQYDEYLNLREKGLRSVVVIAMGYRAEDDFFSEMKKVRRGVENVVLTYP